MAVFRGEYAPLDAGGRARLSVLVGEYEREEMWHAHQVSLYEGIDLAWHEFFEMPLGERTFVANSVIPNVGNSALSNMDPNFEVPLPAAIDNSLTSFGMDDWLANAYPSVYPATGPMSLFWDPANVSWLSGVDSFDDVGLDSQRWRP